jgi:hypothetical protein
MLEVSTRSCCCSLPCGKGGMNGEKKVEMGEGEKRQKEHV